MKRKVLFGTNYILLDASPFLYGINPTEIIGHVNIGLDRLKPAPYPDEDPFSVTQRLADATAEMIESRINRERGRVLSVCVMPFFFRLPLWHFPSSDAAAMVGFHAMSESGAQASIVIATTLRTWDASYCSVIGHSEVSVPVRFRTFDNNFAKEFMDRSSYRAAFAVYGEGVNPYFLRMPELFTKNSLERAYPIILGEIMRRACEAVMQ